MRLLILFCLAFASLLAQSTPTITAASYLVADNDARILVEQNINEVRPIGSITKLMTVMVVLDAHQDMNEKLGGMTRQERIMMALVHSDNKSAAILCASYPGGRDACIRAMNHKAHDLKMPDTKFVEATGLSVFDVSTARDLMNLVLISTTYPIIVEAGHTSQVKIHVRRKWLIFKNTNPMIGYDQRIVVSKTGFIRAAGGCLVMALDTEVGRRIVILLGSRDTRTRIPEAGIIVEHAN
jgi:serine-type D-Ala-D-Ala endopeptidase (penicillin-binding protein 7)